MKKNKRIINKYDMDFRFRIVKIIIFVIFAIIILRILYLNLYMGSYYKMKISDVKETVFYGESVPRGRILDINGKVLVDNKAIKSITYRKPFGISVDKEIKTSYEMSDVLNLNYNNLKDRNKKEFYILINKDETDKLISDEEYKKLDNRKLTLNDIYELKIKRISDDNIRKMKKEDLKAAYLYYLMNNGYYYEEKIIKNNVSDREYAYCFFKGYGNT